MTNFLFYKTLQPSYAYIKTIISNDCSFEEVKLFQGVMSMLFRIVNNPRFLRPHDVIIDYFTIVYKHSRQFRATFKYYTEGDARRYAHWHYLGSSLALGSAGNQFSNFGNRVDVYLAAGKVVGWVDYAPSTEEDSNDDWGGH